MTNLDRIPLTDLQKQIIAPKLTKLNKLRRELAEAETEVRGMLSLVNPEMADAESGWTFIETSMTFERPKKAESVIE